MRIRAKISLLVLALIAAVIGSIVLNLIFVERRQVHQEFGVRTDALMEGILRIARESLSSHDELMLLSYLKFLMGDYPDIELAVVSRQGHTSLLGKVRDELFYRSLTITEPAAASFHEAPSTAPPPRRDAGVSSKIPIPPSSISIQIGFSKAALDRKIRRAQEALLLKILGIAGVGLVLGMAGSLWVARRLSQPVAALAQAAGRFGEGSLDAAVEERGTDEIGDLAKQFNRMAASLRDLIQFKEDLMSTLSHELNTPLGGLKGFLEYLEGADSPQSARERKESYQTMSDAVQQMEISLANALQLYRTGARLVVRPERVCLNEILEEAIRLFTPMAKSNHIAIHGPSGSVPIYLGADKELLRRIAINLVSNALKYSPPGGEVTIRLEEEDGRANLSVADAGSGISPEDQQRIFTKFYRAPGPGGKPQRIPGSGLGLYIVKQAVDLHRGMVWVESKIGQGSVFHVSLPKGSLQNK